MHIVSRNGRSRPIEDIDVDEARETQRVFAEEFEHLTQTAFTNVEIHLRPVRDVKSTARYLATQNGGGFFFFLQLYADKHEGDFDYRSALREYAEEMMVPALELWTTGLLADSSMLDAVLEQTQTNETRDP